MQKRKVFKPRLKTTVDRQVLSSVGKRFQARRAVREIALSLILRSFLGTAKLPFDESQSAVEISRNQFKLQHQTVLRNYLRLLDMSFILLMTDDTTNCSIMTLETLAMTREDSDSRLMTRNSTRPMEKVMTRHVGLIS